MRFFVEESDDLAKEAGDDVSSTYYRSAKEYRRDHEKIFNRFC